jgi:nitrilase
MKLTTFKAASVLASPIFLDREATLDKACHLIKEAGNEGARLIAFPESFIPCYPWWIYMGLKDFVKKGELYKRLYNNSVEIPSESTDLICRAARQYHVMVMVGLNEVRGGSVYNTQLFISEDGEIMGRHRKLMPNLEERTVYGFGEVNELKVFDTKYGRIGGLICYEHLSPLFKYALFSMGEQIHIACWPGGNFKIQARERNKVIDTAMREAALEGQVFCICSCTCLSQEEVDFYSELEPSVKGKMSAGGGWACIINPIGNYIAGPLSDKEGIIYADIDLEEIIEAKHMLDTIGHSARWEVIDLILNSKRSILDTLPDKGGEIGKAFASGRLKRAIDTLKESVQKYGDQEVLRAIGVIEAEMLDR